MSFSDPDNAILALLYIYHDEMCYSWKKLRLYFWPLLLEYFCFRMNGGMEQKTPGHNTSQHKAPKNYKLLVDPFLVKGATKLYRYDGLVPGDSSFPPVQCRDPRSQLSRIWSRMEPADLPVPRYYLYNGCNSNFNLQINTILQVQHCRTLLEIY